MNKKVIVIGFDNSYREKTEKNIKSSWAQKLIFLKRIK